MNEIYIFIFGTVVFMLTIGAFFVSLLASDHPDEQQETSGEPQVQKQPQRGSVSESTRRAVVVQFEEKKPGFSQKPGF